MSDVRFVLMSGLIVNESNASVMLFGLSVSPLKDKLRVKYWVKFPEITSLLEFGQTILVQ